MKTAIYSLQSFEQKHLRYYNNAKHELITYDIPLDEHSAELAQGCEAASLFVTDTATPQTLDILKAAGVKYLVLRSAGYNHVDVAYAHSIGLRVSNVPDYSPFAVAEHAIALILALNRKIILSQDKIHHNDFSLDELVGFDLHGSTLGIIGLGRIGSVVARIALGFGCRVQAYEINPDISNMRYGANCTTLRRVLSESDIVSLHLPLTESTKHLINAEKLSWMKPGAMLINTARGALVDTEALIAALKSGKIGAYGADVYEFENKLFFKDRSGELLNDDLFARLLTFKNVLITGHQAFLTDTALKNIALTTIKNLDNYEKMGEAEYEILTPVVKVA